MKETWTTKLIKRFYGITGPLDEYRRQQVDRVGNICFIWLFYIIIFGNVIAIFVGQKHPEWVAIAYPFALTFLPLLLYFVVASRQNFDIVQTIDVEELNEKEKKQIHHLGLKSGLFFGIFMWLFSPFGSEHNYLTELLSLSSLIGAILAGFFFGISMHYFAKTRIK